jgi:hypothetical protein
MDLINTSKRSKDLSIRFSIENGGASRGDGVLTDRKMYNLKVKVEVEDDV